MKALVTGASSGIGRSIALYLSSLGYELILVARDKDKLEELQNGLKTKTKVIVMDLGSEQKVKELYVLTKNEEVDLLVNNAGFGVFGRFTKTELADELAMIDVNIRALHILTKLFLKDMKKRDSGYILNVASSAAFQPGPLMASYYASKAYVLHLTEAIAMELKKSKHPSNVHISCLCPGPVDTNFNAVAGVRFSVKPMTSDVVGKYAIDKMLKGKLVIIPGFQMKCARFFGHFLSDWQLMKFTYRIQRKKKS